MTNLPLSIAFRRRRELGEEPAGEKGREVREVGAEGQHGAEMHPMKGAKLKEEGGVIRTVTADIFTIRPNVM